jgi:hypothetical protein
LGENQNFENCRIAVFYDKKHLTLGFFIVIFRLLPADAPFL